MSTKFARLLPSDTDDNSVPTPESPCQHPEQAVTTSRDQSASRCENLRGQLDSVTATLADEAAPMAESGEFICSNTKESYSSKGDSTFESHAGDSSDSNTARNRKRHAKRSEKASDLDCEDATPEAVRETDISALEEQVHDLQTMIAELKMNITRSPVSNRQLSTAKTSRDANQNLKKYASYKRVDHLWNNKVHDYVLKESAKEHDKNELSEYAFQVRRNFNAENKYLNTIIIVKVRPLRTVVREVMKEYKHLSLEAEEPFIPRKVLFVYLEDLRAYYQTTLETKIRAEMRSEVIGQLRQQQIACETLVGYVDEEYSEMKKTLFPLLEAGNITFDLLWALFRPNEVTITSCYGAWNEPRCFKLDHVAKEESLNRGKSYRIGGMYLDYDGRSFGYGRLNVDVEFFEGSRKITSLATYPLKYHRNPESFKQQIIARGQKFVAMKGMGFKFHKGLAFAKVKKQVRKININGRVMIDPATFRRINPNYPITDLHSQNDSKTGKNDGDDSSSSSSSSSSVSTDQNDDIVSDNESLESIEQTNDDVTYYTVGRVRDVTGKWSRIAIEIDEHGEPIPGDCLYKIDNARMDECSFTQEELLLTSPVVLGFAFSEKLWLEFSVSGIRDLEWNNDAFETLVLPGDMKNTVRALVESQNSYAANTIDDVVQGKGKGLVFLLHGPPGTGKTLTAEGISELLKCPLYVVSAGELGTDPVRLEIELQKILDVAHTWGAVLLLDEADVFMEKREIHHVQRNALVSIFLRLLEYFQGILFLTTNRVETFDEAFQSRVHVALRYDELTSKARKEVWKTFVEKVRKQSGVETANFSEEDFNVLSRQCLNGRQIKNMVRTAQALALNDGEKLKMSHLRRILNIGEAFENDLKGGAGYIDAMRSYT